MPLMRVLRPAAVLGAATIMGCSSAVPYHAVAGLNRPARCSPERVAQRHCPNHPYQCLGDLPAGYELLGLIEDTRDQPLEALAERAALEGGDLVVIGPERIRQMRLGAPPNPGHVYRRAAVIRLPPIGESRCRAPADPEGN